MSVSYVFTQCSNRLLLGPVSFHVAADHASCPGSRPALPGVLGGAVCACECHVGCVPEMSDDELRGFDEALFQAERAKAWEEEARRYAENAAYWRARAIAAGCPNDPCAIEECIDHGHCCAVTLHERVLGSDDEWEDVPDE